MDATTRSRPVTVYVLLALLVVLGLWGLVGGIGMLMDPSGEGMGLDVSLLTSVPVNDFLIPGLILLTVFGVLPLLAAYGMWAFSNWALLQRLNPWPDYHWSWSWARVIGVLLLLWIVLEFLMWGNASPLQPTFLALSFAILIMSEYGSVKRYAAIDGGRTTELTTENTEDAEDE